MATTRSRTGTPRSKKSAKTTQVSEEQSSKQNPTPGGTDTVVPEVTGAMLERREIPSFSVSREARIAEAAYWRAERRGFIAGHELDDWLEAEREIDGGTASQSGERS